MGPGFLNHYVSSVLRHHNSFTTVKNKSSVQGCQPHTTANIENWWGRDYKWRHNAQGTWRHLWKKCIKRCCGNCNIWANWFTSHQSQYCLLCNGIPEFVRECSMLTVKSWNNAKYSKKFYCRKVHSTRIGKLWRLSGRFQTLICRPGEIWRSGSTAGRYMWWQP